MNYEIIEYFLDEDACECAIWDAMSQITVAMCGAADNRVEVPDARWAFNVKLANGGFSSLLNKKAKSQASLLSGPASREVESTEIVAYCPGGHFIRHHDGLHRSHTLVTFLNDGYQGGELIFDDVTFSAMPAGSAVIWENTEDAWHRCEPILRGFKWIAITWLFPQVR